MRWSHLHAWHVTPEEAERIQSSLATRAGALIPRPVWHFPAMVAGAAVSGQTAAVVVLDAKSWGIVEVSRVDLPASATEDIRYLRGLMAFALGPLLLQAFEGIESAVDVVIFRAHGIAHPRRCGMATHLGLLLGTPSVGCADRLLVGEHALPGPQHGDWTPVTDGCEIVGACVTTRQGSKPVFVSPGYGLGIEEAMQIVLGSTLGDRLPEPLHQARMVARET